MTKQIIEAPLWMDFYKTFHPSAYRPGTEKVYSNFTTRHNKHSNVRGSTTYVAGLQACIQKVLMEGWAPFFAASSAEEAVADYCELVSHGLGSKETAEHFKALWELGYLPLRIQALEEGSEVPYGIPHFTIESTVDGFGWLTNAMEDALSCEIWPVQTALTTAAHYYKTFKYYAELTGSPEEAIPFQGHDFSFRGMVGIEGAKLMGMGHLMSGFVGSDTMPAALSLKKYYDATLNPETPCQTIASVCATEHSVQCSFQNDDEAYLDHCMNVACPEGILSIVSDGYDFWKLVTKVLPARKDQIMARNGKIVIRPDSGDPTAILCGDRSAATVHERKGLIEVLWDIFGGTENEEGYRVLDSHIGAIYGDSITPARQSEILSRLANKGFASCNIVLGIGSYTYQYVTRDTHGSAMKATAIKVNGSHEAIYKDPKTGDGKKSAKGYLYVHQNDKDYTLLENVDKGLAETGSSALKLVWENGSFVRRTTLEQIRNKVKESY